MPDTLRESLERLSHAVGNLPPLSVSEVFDLERVGPDADQLMRVWKRILVPWANRCVQEVAYHVRHLGLAMLERPMVLDSPAAAVRTAALILAAAEVAGTKDGAGEVARLCRTIAAGVTLLQDRAEGLLPPREALMLIRA
ncbi:hypothetical protein ACH47Z_03730 [Streptomyces sp. NPDC020192]|uniref:hypothetical protein n=1 Tax=Streptomyces sp. NPDC020192 TaxID=3365066 RepID=UPI0037A634A4